MSYGLNSVRPEDVAGYISRNGGTLTAADIVENWRNFLSANGGSGGGTDVASLEGNYLAALGSTQVGLPEKWNEVAGKMGFIESGIPNTQALLRNGVAGYFGNQSLNGDASRGVLTNTAAHFASANKEYLTIPSNSSLQTGDIDFEIGGWVRLDSVSTQMFIQKGATSDNVLSLEYSAFYSTALSKIGFSVSNGTNALTVVADSLGAVSANTWYFIRAWFSKSAEKIYIQVNDGAITSTDVTGTLRTGTANLLFGKGNRGGSDFYFNGRLDSWYFQKRISTTDEATSFYNSGAGRTYNDLTAANGLDAFQSGLTSWWDFNEEGGTRYDSKGTNHLTSTADPIIQPPVYGSELLTNGGFETAGTGGNDVFGSWSEAIGGTGTIVDETSLIHSGSHAAKITQGDVGTTQMRQDFAVTAGKSYYYAFWTRGDGTNAGKYAILDATNGFANIIAAVSTGVSGTTYTLVSGTFVVPTGCSSVRISLQASQVVGGVVYFDDVSVKEITTTSINNGGFEDWTSPTNAAVWSESVAGTSTVNQETTAPYAGSSAVRFDVDASNSAASVSQSILIVGKKYTSTLYAKRTGSTAQISVAGIEVITPTSSYAAYTNNFTASSTSFALARGSATSSSIYIDQVTLTSLGPTAEAGIAAGNAVDGNFGAGFNGTSRYLSVASNASLQPVAGDWELGGWLNVNKLGTEQVIVNKGYITGSGSEYTIWLDAGGTLYFYARLGDNSGYVNTAIAIGVAAVNNWTYWRAYYTQSDNKIRLVVNNGTPSAGVVVTGGVYIGTSNFMLNYSGYSFLNGKEDGVYKINRILTTAEATALYNNGKGLKYAQLPDSIKNDSALKGYWNLDEKSGTRYDSTSNHNDLTDNGSVTQVQGVNYYEGTVGTIFDASGNNNTFTQTTLSKRPTYCSICLNGKPSVNFDGVDDSLMASGDKIGAGDVTVTAVINARGWGGGNTGRIIDNGALIAYLYTDGRVYLISNGGSTIAISAASSIALNTSYIITATRTSAGIVNIYINGTLSGTANQNSGTPVAGSDTYIGNRAAGDRAFDGAISSVLVYNSILTTAQRASLERSLASKYGITLS